METLEACIELAKQGDAKAQWRLVEAYKGRVSGFVFSLVGPTEAVADISQTVFIKALIQLPHLRELDRFESWLFRIARNCCMDHLRSEKVRRIFTAWLPKHEAVASVEQGWESYSDQEPISDKVSQAIQTLPEKQRQVITLMQRGHRDYRQIAEATGFTVEAVKSLFFRARKTLKQVQNHDA